VDGKVLEGLERYVAPRSTSRTTWPRSERSSNGVQSCHRSPASTRHSIGAIMRSIRPNSRGEIQFVAGDGYPFSRREKQPDAQPSTTTMGWPRSTYPITLVDG
jgi:hypothetical protein